MDEDSAGHVAENMGEPGGNFEPEGQREGEEDSQENLTKDRAEEDVINANEPGTDETIVTTETQKNALDNEFNQQSSGSDVAKTTEALKFQQEDEGLECASDELTEKEICKGSAQQTQSHDQAILDNDANEVLIDSDENGNGGIKGDATTKGNEEKGESQTESSEKENKNVIDGMELNEDLNASSNIGDMETDELKNDKEKSETESNERVSSSVTPDGVPGDVDENDSEIARGEHERDNQELNPQNQSCVSKISDADKTKMKGTLESIKSKVKNALLNQFKSKSKRDRDKKRARKENKAKASKSQHPSGPTDSGSEEGDSEGTDDEVAENHNKPNDLQTDSEEKDKDADEKSQNSRSTEPKLPIYVRGPSGSNKGKETQAASTKSQPPEAKMTLKEQAAKVGSASVSGQATGQTSTSGQASDPASIQASSQASGPTSGQTSSPTSGQTSGQTSSQASGPTSGQTSSQASGPTSGQTSSQASGPMSGQTMSQTSASGSTQTRRDPCNCPGCNERKLLEKQQRPVVVRFYVALSPNFSSCTEEYELRIHFFSGPLKGRIYPMKLYQNVSDAFPLFRQDLEFHFKDFEAPAIQYKYQFAHRTKTNEKPHYENSSTGSNHFKNRELDHAMIKKTFESDSVAAAKFVWHQFDGTSRPSKSRMEAFKNFWGISNADSNWLENYENLAQHLMSCWEGLCLVRERAVSGSAEEALRRADHINHCIRNYFLDANGYKFNKNDADQLVKSYLSALLDTVQQELAMNDDATDKKCRFGLATFVSIVRIVKTCNITLDKQLIEMICYHLLLKPDLVNRTCPDYDELLGVHFKTTSKEIKTSLLKFVNEDASKESAHWILVLPLVHFLCNISKPFEDLSHIQQGYDDPSKLWWGEKEIEGAKRQLKHSYLNKGKLSPVLKEYEKKFVELFEMDKMLQRTLLALMDLEDVLMFMPTIPFPADALIANVRFSIKTDPLLIEGKSDRSEKLHSVMKMLVKQIEEDDISVSESTVSLKLDNSKELYKISRDLLDAACYQVRHAIYFHWETVLMACEIFIACSKQYGQLLSHSLVQEKFESAKEPLPSSEELLGSGRQLILKCLNTRFILPMNDTSRVISCFNYEWELRTISALLKLEEKLWEENLKKDWTESFKIHLKMRIQTMKPEPIVDLTVAQNLSEHGSVVETVFIECALKAVESVCKDKDMGAVMVHFRQNATNSSRMSGLLSRLFLKTWPDDTSDGLTMLKHILSWPPFVSFLNAFDDWRKSEFSNINCLTCVEDGLNRLKETLQNLANGQILVQELKVLLDPSNRKQLRAIINRDGCSNLLPSVDGVTQDRVLDTLLDWRNKELDEYCRQLNLVRFFLTRCEDAKSGDAYLLNEKLLGDINLVSLGDVCKCRQLDSFELKSIDDDSYLNPRISRFQLSSLILQNLEEFKKLSNSEWFNQFWKYFLCRVCIGEVVEDDDVSENDIGNDEVDEDADDDVDYPSLMGGSRIESEYRQVIRWFMKRAYEPSKESWMDFGNKISSGSITIKKMEEVFLMLKKDLRKLKAELELLVEDNDDLIQERLSQVQLLQEVNVAVFGAEVILKARKEFDIKGDFSDLEVLKNMTSEKTKPLSAISRTLLTSIKSLKGIDERRAKCLHVFMDNKALAEWLRETVKPDEHRAFIELALVAAANEGAVQVEYINCLDAVVKGFAPLIYRFKEDMCYEDFLELCSEVWDALEIAGNLPKMFEETARNLDFLKQIQSGLTGDGAIALTQFINQTGVFVVGFHEGSTFRELEEVISVKYHKVTQNDDRGNDGQREMNLKQLTDLNNKLMLIVGRDEDIKKEVDKFCEMFDGILRLSKTYIKLCTSGCTLFHRWKVIFYCDQGRKEKVYVNFGGDDLILKSGDKNVADHLLEICQFMESCLEDWSRFVEEQRKEFCYLNFFTTQQLMILQRELSQIRNDSVDDAGWRSVLSLLSLVKKDCSREDTCRSIYTGSMLLKNVEVASDLNGADEAEEVLYNREIEQDEEDSVMSDFIETMVDSNFSRELALRAIESGIDPSRIEEGILWCMDNQDLDESIASYRGESSVEGSEVNETVADGNSNEDSSVRDVSLIQDRAETTISLVAETSRLLQSVIGHDNPLLTKLSQVWEGFLSQTTESYSECLSLKHVGLILKDLAQDAEHLALPRPVPTFLKTSQPNLVLCSKSNVLPTVLSIYAFSNGVALPLPSVDEVLLCSSDTTAEEVELLFRRTLENRSKIYCLVYADLLDYDVACQVEELMLAFFPSSRTEDLHLVVICCVERRSNIVSALDRYTVQLPYIDNEEIRRYLRRHFASKSLEATDFSPSDADINNCNVRMIRSNHSGVGKTLYVKRLKQALQKKHRRNADNVLVTVSLHSKVVDHSKVMKEFLGSKPTEFIGLPRIFHIDVAPEVQEGVDHLLFSLLVLGCITDESGFVWRRREDDLYIVECMPLFTKTSSKDIQRRAKSKLQLVHQIFSLLPSITCWSPQDTLDILNGRLEDVRFRHPDSQISEFDPSVDVEEFSSEELQRPFQYLKQYSTKQNVRKIGRIVPKGTPAECIECLLRHCGVNDPSWSELHNFASFLNVQLKDCENSIFCSDFLSDDLPGFLSFVVKFMIRMSKDFATRSLTISEETPGSFGGEILPALRIPGREEDIEIDERELLQRYAMKRRWETSPHPYLFFNCDHNSFTFMGFVIERQTQNLLDPQTKLVIEPQILPLNLHHALYRNSVNLQEDFESLPRDQKLCKICSVMGQDFPHDPDMTYELTADNVKKILAIFMRFRCQIPVIIMGETGCGKTRLIRFMCDLWHMPGEETENMILMKMHGGVTEDDIMRNLKNAVEIARKNHEKNPKFGTVLFFDEANTTEAIGLIKEIMCDRTCNGKPIPYTEGLHLIAACNPYRKHTDVMINRLEQAGLGYRVRADDTKDKLGYIPLRQLVYRVQALPQSMLPLVWDFGQLSDIVESLYIRQMVNRHFSEMQELKLIPRLEATVACILAASQAFMRSQKDECSFVSLRDVERTLQVMMWFYSKGTRLFELMDEKANAEEIERNHPMDEEEHLTYQSPSRVTRSLILALGVCYHACLQNRLEYRERISKFFVAPCALINGAETVEKEIILCQDVFLDNIGKLGENIARNKALKENVFMMVVCIELRIPLFLVGKPGSSKSLAKTIVGNGMLGKSSKGDLFKTMKSVHMVSFQCSPLSTPEGIIGIFEQCARLQKEKDLRKNVAVVVLDEVGLAEDSPKMPLKTLHPLLEYGCEVEGKIEEYSKVGFIGISNWALDPAKMNRGILVLREVPDEDELLDSAKGICEGEYRQKMSDLLSPLTNAYKELYGSMLLKKKEFFGLRDFYSLLKMVYAFCKKSNREPNWHELKHAIMRNFDGLVGANVLEIFEKHLSSYALNPEPRSADDPDCSSSALIKAGLQGIGLDSESRYLLILTENYVALGLLHQQLEDLKNAVTIFGSSFPKDQEYTQVCRNINRIKTCMESGRTVVLLNLENLYESLYDALNQYYMYFNKQRFVDLGLGTQRVKCKVDKNFRLIVVAEKEVVYEKFPIPLINRLEKHILSMQTMLTDAQMNLVVRLHEWTKLFCATENCHIPNKRQPAVGDVFIGYHADTPASIILQLWKQNGLEEVDKNKKKEIFNRAKSILLQCATPDALIRLSASRWGDDTENLWRQYFTEQRHSSLAELLKQELVPAVDPGGDSAFLQVTTHSHLLSKGDLPKLSNALGVIPQNIHLHSLQGFDTEQQFCSLLRDVFKLAIPKDNKAIDMADESVDFSVDTPLNHAMPSSDISANHLFILQCDSGDVNAELIACARYNVFTEYTQILENQLNGRHQSGIHVVFIIQLPRVPGGCFAGFQGGKWRCWHLDELLPAKEFLPDLSTLMQLRVSELLQQKTNSDDSETETRSSEQSAEEHGVSGDRTLGMDAELSKFDVYAVILNCLHRSASLLKDSDDSAKSRSAEDIPSDSSNRKFHRLEQLLKLLTNSSADLDKISLMDVIKTRLGRLMRDKETSCQTPEQAGSWLRDEVSALEATEKAGTFRRSLLQTVESKVTPLLSGIIAYVDKNANLDLLLSESPWKQKLWLIMLNEEEVTLFRYRDMNFPDHRHVQSEFPEFHVTNTGCNGRYFQCAFPFSWVVKDQIDCLIHESKKSGKSLDVLGHLLEGSELGNILKRHVDEDSGSEAIDAYLSDFVQMVFKSKSCSETEIKWVMEDLRKTMRSQRSLTEGLLDQFMRIHLAYNIIRPRIQLFSEFSRIWPEDKQFLAKEPDDSWSLDLRMLSAILENLNSGIPKKDESRNWADWAETADLFYPFVQQLINSFDLNAADSKVQQHFETCCKRWSRLHALQLFVKRVYLSETTVPSLVANNCRRLYQILGENADFKQIKSFEHLEIFIKSCNKKATEFFINLGACSHCSEQVTDPVELPCGHVICLKCIHEMKELNLLVCSVPECNKRFSRDIKIEPLKTKRKEVIAHDHYRKCLNSFFMGVIHSLCFLRNSPPSDQVIEKLMKFVTLGAKETFDEKADPSPVIRSFVLQVLLQSKIEVVRNYLDKYFAEARETLKTTEEEFSELCVLIVGCIEDYYRSLNCTKNSIQDEVKFISEILDSLRPNQMSFEGAPSSSVLESYGKLRYVLNQTSIWIHQTHVLEHSDLPKKDFGLLLKKLGGFLEAEASEWPRIYLMRVICHNYGLEILRLLASVPRLHWILPQQAKKEFEILENDILDRFLIYGENYKNIRDQIYLMITLGKGTESLSEFLQSIEKSEKHRDRLAILAIFRSVTLSYRHSGDKKPSDQAKKSVMDYCSSLPYLTEYQELLTELIENKLPGSLLSVSSEQSPRKLTLAELMAHCYIVMFTLQKQKFLSPFLSLIFNPSQLQNSFLPVMPQDDLGKFKALIAQTENNANTAAYKCPNGHPYLIGECGNPNFERPCPECGCVIGGLNHILKPGNVRLQTVVDETRRGHCIGPAHQRTEDPIAERDLSPAEASLLRLLLHMSMYLGAASHSADICKLIAPEIPETQAENYFRYHIATDLRHVGVALGKNEDDVFLLAHLLLRELTIKNPKNCPPNLPVLATKEERQEWENLFVRTYITPVIQMLDSSAFGETQESLRKDNSIFGNSSLVQMLFEVDRPLGSGDADRISHLWRFRAQISLENLTQQLGCDVTGAKNQEQEHAILRLFLQEKHRLCLLRFLPNIVKLNRIMKQHLLQQRSKETESTQWTIGSKEFRESFSNVHIYEEIGNLVEDFAAAWKAVRQNLLSYGFSGGFRLTEDQCNRSIDDSTKIATFLSSARGDGLCSVALVSYLCDIQNQFMEKYSELSHQSLEMSVDADDASVSQIVILHEQQDILPLLLANSAYSLKAGEGTVIRYDFSGLEKQIEERFVRGKPRLRPYKVDNLVSLEEGSFVKLFEQLRQRIHQEPLPSQLKSEVCMLRKDLSALSSLIGDLNTALGYLAFIGGKSTQSLQHFMSSVLRMKPKLKSGKVQDICLKHFESLWLTVSFLKTQLMLRFNQDPFEAVGGKYREALTEEMSSELKEFLSGVQDIDLLSLSLFECILFCMTVRRSDDEEGNADENLRLILNTYVEQKTNNSPNWNFPKKIQVKHCLDTWKQLVAFQAKSAKHS